MSDINPWNIFLQETPMDNEIAFRSLYAFTSVKRTADMLHRIEEKRLQESDFELRDILLTGRKKEEFEHPSLFHYAKEHYKGFKSFDSSVKYDNIMKECVRRKYFFWRKYLKEKPETKEGHESRSMIVQTVRSYKLPSQITFSVLGVGISYFLGLYKNPISFRVMTVLTGLLFGTFYGEFKYATQIFNSLPVLPDNKMEQERQDVYNYCFSLDIKQIADALTKEEELDVSQPTSSKEPAKK